MLHRSTPIAAGRELAADRRATSCRPIADGRELAAELAASWGPGPFPCPFGRRPMVFCMAGGPSAELLPAAGAGAELLPAASSSAIGSIGSSCRP